MSISYKDLLAQRAELENKIQLARKAELSDAVSKVRNLVAEYELTEDDVFPKNGGKKVKIEGAVSKVAPKFRDPATGATWTGRGKAPLWIMGKDRDQFLIEAAPAAAADAA